MPSELLAAHNLLIGTTNILVIGMPEGWRLVEGYAHPEVDEWTEYREWRWATRGQGVYRLVEGPDLIKTEVELSVLATPTLVLAEGGMPLTVAGHSGVIFQASVLKGILPRRTLPALKVEWICPHTARLIRILMNGVPKSPLDRDALQVLLDAVLGGVQCH